MPARADRPPARHPKVADAGHRSFENPDASVTPADTPTTG
jgi:hypothetical protein